jgi:hypothetical protein
MNERNSECMNSCKCVFQFYVSFFVFTHHRLIRVSYDTILSEIKYILEYLFNQWPYILYLCHSLKSGQNKTVFLHSVIDVQNRPFQIHDVLRSTPFPFGSYSDFRGEITYGRSVLKRKSGLSRLFRNAAFRLVGQTDRHTKIFCLEDPFFHNRELLRHLHNGNMSTIERAIRMFLHSSNFKLTL